jgi:hypothetical protein
MVKVVQPCNWIYIFEGHEGKRSRENAPADNWSVNSSRSLARQFVTLNLVPYYNYLGIKTWQKLLTGSQIRLA